jgi:hypothetical protein
VLFIYIYDYKLFVMNKERISDTATYLTRKCIYIYFFLKKKKIYYAIQLYDIYIIVYLIALLVQSHVLLEVKKKN